MAAAAPVIGIAMSLYGMKQQKDAADDAKDIANQNALNEQRATDKAAKDLAETNARREALARARASASGVGGATTLTYIAELEDKGRKEIDWLKEIGVSKYNAAQQEGDVAYNQAMSGFWGSVGSGISNTADLGVQQNWWS